MLFAHHGAQVVVSDVHPARTEETVALIRAQGGEAVGVVADMADTAAIKAMVDRKAPGTNSRLYGK